MRRSGALANRTFRLIGASAAAIGLAGLGLRAADTRADRALWRRLAATAPAEPTTFDPALADALPEPARRFFRQAFEPGTPLRRVAELEMSGVIDFGTLQRPAPRPMQARRILAPPHGFVWQVSAWGLPPMTGTDALSLEESWSRFRLAGLLPVGRASGDDDHRRSSFGRMVGEGVFWTPAAFLPGGGSDWDEIVWSAIDADTARVRVRQGDFSQSADLTVDPQGRPIRIVFPRWSNANAARRHRLQPFGGDLSDSRAFDGICVPTRLIGGNHYGTPLYHPFFHARISAVRFR